MYMEDIVECPNRPYPPLAWSDYYAWNPVPYNLDYMDHVIGMTQLNQPVGESRISQCVSAGTTCEACGLNQPSGTASTCLLDTYVSIAKGKSSRVSN